MCICTFAGHAIIFSAGVEKRLEEEIERFLLGVDDAAFYVGGRGEFDKLAAIQVRKAKFRHKDKKIRLYLIEPYMTQRINLYKDAYERWYDGIIVPQELFGIYPKSAIKIRNRWMIDHSEMLIAYVRQDSGGAWETLNYAKQKTSLNIVNLAE